MLPLLVLRTKRFCRPVPVSVSVYLGICPCLASFRLSQCNVHVSSGLYMRMSTTMALTVIDYWYCHCHVYGYWCCHWFCYGQSVHVGPCQSLSRFLSVSVSVSVRLCLFLSLIRVSNLFEAAHSAEMQRFETSQGLTYFAVS